MEPYYSPDADLSTQPPRSRATEKPSILEIIGQRVELRKAGKEFLGRCPFHADKTPSFSVTEEKGLFHCFGCGESGDVFDFIMKIDGLSFSRACNALGIESDKKSRPALTPSRKRAAGLAAAWVNEQRVKIGLLIGERLEERDLADEVGAFDLGEMFDREVIMLREFYESLEHPRGAVEMLAMKESIAKITTEIDLYYQPPTPLPALTEAYRRELQTFMRGAA